MTLRAAWENDSCRNSLVNQELKKIEEMSRAENFALHLKYIPPNKTLLTHPPILCLTLIVPCLRRRGLEFKQGLGHTF